MMMIGIFEQGIGKESTLYSEHNPQVVLSGWCGVGTLFIRGMLSIVACPTSRFPLYRNEQVEIEAETSTLFICSRK